MDWIKKNPFWVSHIGIAVGLLLAWAYFSGSMGLSAKQKETIEGNTKKLTGGIQGPGVSPEYLRVLQSFDSKVKGVEGAIRRHLRDRQTGLGNDGLPPESLNPDQRYFRYQGVYVKQVANIVEKYMKRLQAPDGRAFNATTVKSWKHPQSQREFLLPEIESLRGLSVDEQLKLYADRLDELAKDRRMERLMVAGRILGKLAMLAPPGTESKEPPLKLTEFHSQWAPKDEKRSIDGYRVKFEIMIDSGKISLLLDHILKDSFAFEIDLIEIYPERPKGRLVRKETGDYERWLDPPPRVRVALELWMPDYAKTLAGGGS